MLWQRGNQRITSNPQSTSWYRDPRVSREWEKKGRRRFVVTGDFRKKRNKPGDETTVKNLITWRENEFATSEFKIAGRVKRGNFSRLSRMFPDGRCRPCRQFAKRISSYGPSRTWPLGIRPQPGYLPASSTRIYLRAATPISPPPKNWQFACKFRAMFRPLSTPAASSYPPRAFFQANVPPETTGFTSTFRRTVRQHAFRFYLFFLLNSQFIGPWTAANFPFALHPSSRNIFRLTFSHYFHSTVSSCSLLFSIAKCLWIPSCYSQPLTSHLSARLNSVIRSYQRLPGKMNFQLSVDFILPSADSANAHRRVYSFFPVLCSFLVYRKFQKLLPPRSRRRVRTPVFHATCLSSRSTLLNRPRIVNARLSIYSTGTGAAVTLKVTRVHAHSTNKQP